MILKVLAGTIGAMLAEVGTTSGGRKVGSGARAVGSALVMSSLGALGHPRGRRKSRLGCWRCGCTRRTRAWWGEPWAPWHLRDGQRKNSPQKDPGQEQATRDKEGRWLILETAGVVGLSHVSVPNSGGYCTHRF